MGGGTREGWAVEGEMKKVTTESGTDGNEKEKGEEKDGKMVE